MSRQQEIELLVYLLLDVLIFMFFFPKPNLSLPSTCIANSPPSTRLNALKRMMFSLLSPSLPLTPCLLCAAMNIAVPAVAAFSPLPEELL